MGSCRSRSTSVHNKDTHIIITHTCTHTHEIKQENLKGTTPMMSLDYSIVEGTDLIRSTNSNPVIQIYITNTDPT